MSGDQEKSTTSTGAEQAPNPPALPQYPPQPFPGAPYPPPPGAYTWYYPPPADPNGDPSAPPPPGPYVMFPPPGIMYGYPPPPTPTQGESCLFRRVFRVLCVNKPTRLRTVSNSCTSFRCHACKAQTSQDGGMIHLLHHFPYHVDLHMSQVHKLCFRVQAVRRSSSLPKMPKVWSHGVVCRRRA